MKAAVDILEGAFHGRCVGDIALDKLGRRRDIAARPGREVVEYAHPMPSIEQILYQMGTNKPGTAGHEVARHAITLTEIKADGAE
jgi:hypothetical protein